MTTTKLPELLSECYAAMAAAMGVIDPEEGPDRKHSEILNKLAKARVAIERYPRATAPAEAGDGRVLVSRSTLHSIADMIAPGMTTDECAKLAGILHILADELPLATRLAAGRDKKWRECVDAFVGEAALREIRKRFEATYVLGGGLSTTNPPPTEPTP